MGSRLNGNILTPMTRYVNILIALGTLFLPKMVVLCISKWQLDAVHYPISF